MIGSMGQTPGTRGSVQVGQVPTPTHLEGKKVRVKKKVFYVIHQSIIESGYKYLL